MFLVSSCRVANFLTVSGRMALIAALIPGLVSCAQVDVPGARNAHVPSPAMADERPEAVNEKPDSVLYLPLGSDVLVPEVSEVSPLPTEMVGPFELAIPMEAS